MTRTPHRAAVARLAAQTTLRLVLAAGLLLHAFAALATSVRAVDLTEMLEGAELVFEGRVVGHQVLRGLARRDIYTEVTFEVLDLVKGDYAGDTITLPFAGGAIGDERVIVSDMHPPAVGERGVYFVESLQRRQVHPLIGWDQGSFVVEADAAGAGSVVMTRDRRKVYGVGVDQRLDTARARLSDGAAVGLRLHRRSDDEAAMTIEQFKRTLRAMRPGVLP